MSALTDLVLPWLFAGVVSGFWLACWLQERAARRRRALVEDLGFDVFESDDRGHSVRSEIPRPVADSTTAQLADLLLRFPRITREQAITIIERQRQERRS